MRWISLVIIAVAALAGCADSAPPPEEPTTGIKPEVDENTGAICAVVVDQTIAPLADVKATMDVEGEARTETSNAEGQFCFGKLPPGFYNIVTSKPGYLDAAVQAEAKKGVTNPEMLSIRMDRLFDQDPFVSPFKFDGRLACHVYAVLLTAPCVTDWTQLVPQVCGSGCFPDLRTIMGDARDFMGAVDAGWQVHIVEMTWKQSSQATSSHMGLILRDFTVGGANHQYGEVEGSSPLWIRFDVGEVHPTQSGDASEQIPPEGYDQIIHFAGVRPGPDDYVAAAVEQEFTVFANTFYFGIPPETWSFVNGDDYPF